MGEDNREVKDQDTEMMEQILRERERLDKLLQSKFRKKLAVLFSDVCGFTEYMDRKGDIGGRAWIQQHHDIVLPAIERNRGKVLDIMGDGIMAVFEKTIDAVKASMNIQRDLDAYNATVDRSDSIHVKIGINAGEVLTDRDHIAGDVVNVASRIQGQAGPEQILVDKSVFDEVCGSEDVICRLHGKVKVKGKAKELELYRVIWRDDDIVLSAEPRVRADEAARRMARKPLKVLQLEINQEGDRLKISASENIAGEVSTVRQYEEIEIEGERLGERCRSIIETLNNVNRQGRITREVLFRLRETGQSFRDELFTMNVKEQVNKTDADHLILVLDDALVHIPWELLHDGKKFLCQKFKMGRLVRTRQTGHDVRERALGRPLKMLVLADPKGDLREAYLEGTQIRDFADKHRELLSVSFRSGDIKRDFVKEKIRNFDIVHFAGHADYNLEDPGESGWRLSNGILTARDIMKMAGTAALPALVFSNACQSARSETMGVRAEFQNEIFGLANAFIMAGVKHYLGTFWEVLDEPSRRFAQEFYMEILSGKTIGEAVRKARLALISDYGEETIVWASYLLYGDPTFNYIDQVAQEESESEKVSEPPPAPAIEGEVRAREEVIDFDRGARRKVKWGWIGLAAGVLVLAMVLFFGYPGMLKDRGERYGKAAITAYQEGDFERALEICATLQEKTPDSRITYLIIGNIMLRRGDLDAAEAAFRKALNARKGNTKQKADALVGLGRVYSIRGNSSEALKLYEQAAREAPSSRTGYISQALLLEGRGDYSRAVSLLEKAQSLGGQDRLVAAMVKEARKKASYATDSEKQERIDRLVKELLEAAKQPPRAFPSDSWSSRPLTLWIMDPETKGYSIQEGEERLLVSGITDRLIQRSRVQVVERALLDRLLEELKLGRTNLVDRHTALSLGRILAARLILSGQVVYSGPQTQVSLRLIETETGRIRAAINKAFGSAVPLATLAESLSKELIEEFGGLYPLRGRIEDVEDSEININIGQRVGVKIGATFKVIDTDLILEVNSVQPDNCIARVVEGKQPVKKGMRVEAIEENGT
ncbi:MAG: CHAT domain-containing protein [Deltaproteobacteria bacterium]|nr:CHAT domain-containing protein [Deltaproteobacteria bacterium]MBW2138061.1 CHAT domain-containing protein [Deltaproteobacteria bacterium]